jgi:cyclophilin family peptidyl-prolyl cis-trans isomerase
MDEWYSPAPKGRAMHPVRPLPARTRWIGAALLLCLAAGGCGDEGKNSEPAGEKVARGWTKRSSDAAVAAIQQKIERWLSEKRIDPSKEDWRRSLPLRPTVEFDPKKEYDWNLDTSEGILRLRLRPATAPEHVANLLYLTLLGFHDGLPLHSIVPGKSAEGGSPTPDGQGSPGYALTGPEKDANTTHDRAGLLSAVGLGPSTDGSRFRLTFGPDPSLDEFGTIHGEVFEGRDVLEKIEALGTPSGQPTKPVVVRSAWITVR